jgi:hypothetical protein
MSGDENYIPTFNYLGLLHSHSHRFAHPPLDLVALHRFSDPSPDNESKAAVCQLVGRCRQHQQGMSPGRTLAADSLKVGIGSQAIIFAHYAPSAGRQASVTPSGDGVLSAGGPLELCAHPLSASAPGSRALDCGAVLWAAMFVLAFYTSFVRSTLSKPQHAIIPGFPPGCKSGCCVEPKTQGIVPGWTGLTK